jgi:hypothetical protein
MTEREDRIAALERQIMQADRLAGAVSHYMHALPESQEELHAIGKMRVELKAYYLTQGGIDAAYTNRRLEVIEAVPDIKRRLDRARRQEGLEG